MANGVLGLGSGQAASLNNELIDKLKAAERKSAVEPIETRITKITGEKTIMNYTNFKAPLKLDDNVSISLGSGARYEFSANSSRLFEDLRYGIDRYMNFNSGQFKILSYGVEKFNFNPSDGKLRLNVCC